MNKNSHYEDKICEAIEYIVDNAINKAEYDKTIQATVVKVIDQTIGKYSVKYQDSIFYAYSNSIDTKYNQGTDVYVLIPGNDTGRDKTILGAIKKLGINYANNPEGDEAFESIGNNCIELNTEFNLCSYNQEQTKIIYDRENNINEIQLNLTSAENYIKQSSYILCGGQFKTALPKEQQLKGNYGIIFELVFLSSAEELIYKNYVVDINQMQGNPYLLTSATRQYAIFEINGGAFQYINKITLFETGFPNIIDNKPNDIFISSLELTAMNKLSEEQLSSYALSFITPQGTYFDKTHLPEEKKTIEAQVRIKGRPIDNNSQSLKYYWFIENANINFMSEKYNRYGGSGWECINNYNIIKEAQEAVPAIIEWISADYKMIVQKSDVLGQEKKYKCVAVYDETPISREITIVNYSSEYNITIESDKGTAFYFDQGNPTLTCKINEQELIGEDYSYAWGVLDNNNIFNTLTAVENTDMKIDNNKVYNYHIGSILNFSTIKCSVFYKNNYLGTAEITLTNSLEIDKLGYSLVINNGIQLFKYNEQGVSPASGALENPVLIQDLSFTLFDKNGKELPVEDCVAKWIFPKNNTMIKSSKIQEPIEETEEFLIYGNHPSIDYSIANLYDVNKTNNTIQLDIEYKSISFSAKTDFTFLKEGDTGTNGTEYICKIVPNIGTGEAPLYPMILNGQINYIPRQEGKWFRVQLWHNGELIFNDVQDGLSNEGAQVEIEWSILKNKYRTSVSDSSSIEIDNAKAGVFRFIDYLSDSPANIIKCTLIYKDLVYYATQPLITAYTNNIENKIVLKDYSGFRYATYTTDGRSPQYDNSNPFEIESNLTDELSYEWKICGKLYKKILKDEKFVEEWVESKDLEQQLHNLEELKNNQAIFKPADEYYGECVSNAIECIVKNGDIEIGKIHIPIHLMLNRYGNAAMNDWDGNSISINEDNGFILAPQIGAGKKNEETNTFTGVFMGTVQEANKVKSETGLFGYNDGQRTISLNAEDGSAIFGKLGDGQIVLDPAADKAMLYSHNFWKTYDDETGMPSSYGSGNENQAGLLIDLTTPEIRFGNGKFKVGADGVLSATDGTFTGVINAKAGGTIGGFTIKDNCLYSGRDTLGGSTAGVYIGTDGITVAASGSKYVQLSKAGGLIAKEADISGTVSAKKGNIGGWEISTYAIEGGETILDSEDGITTNTIIIDTELDENPIKGEIGAIRGKTDSTYTYNIGITSDDENSIILESGRDIRLTCNEIEGIWLDGGYYGTVKYRSADTNGEWKSVGSGGVAVFQ